MFSILIWYSKLVRYMNHRASNIESLKHLAILGAHTVPVTISSAEFAEAVDTSSQTAARRLQALDDAGLIARTFVPQGQIITITQAGKTVIEREYIQYRKIFDGLSCANVLHGAVITGLGEGKYYTQLHEYVIQFEDILGFAPYPGTLNIELDTESINIFSTCRPEGITLDGFVRDERTFGDVECINVRIFDIEGAIVRPKRTHYPDNIIEIIAPVNMRESFDLNDGSQVNVEILLD